MTRGQPTQQGVVGTVWPTFWRLGYAASLARDSRRGASPGTPWVAPVLDAHGLPVVTPEVIDTSNEGCGIEAALIASTVRARLPHARLLQLSRQLAAGSV